MVVCFMQKYSRRFSLAPPPPPPRPPVFLTPGNGNKFVASISLSKAELEPKERELLSPTVGCCIGYKSVLLFLSHIS